MSKILMEGKNLTVAYDEPKNQLFLTWNGFLNSTDFREAAREVIRAVEQTKATAILSDNTNWKTISPNDRGWAAYNWFPEAEAKGVKKLATVLSRDYFNRISQKSIEALADVRCMEVKNFNTIEEAQNWLSNSKTPACA